MKKANESTGKRIKKIIDEFDYNTNLVTRDFNDDKFGEEEFNNTLINFKNICYTQIKSVIKKLIDESMPEKSDLMGGNSVELCEAMERNSAIDEYHKKLCEKLAE